MRWNSWTGRWCCSRACARAGSVQSLSHFRLAERRPALAHAVMVSLISWSFSTPTRAASSPAPTSPARRWLPACVSRWTDAGAGWTTCSSNDCGARADGREAHSGIAASFSFYNTGRPHQALGHRTPMAVWRQGGISGFANPAVDMTLRLDDARASPTCPQPQQQQQLRAA